MASFMNIIFCLLFLDALLGTQFPMNYSQTTGKTFTLSET